MGHAFHTPAPPPQRRTRWRRERRRAWSRPSNLPGTGSLYAAIPVLPRDELVRLTERMIDRMDQIDGDPDWRICARTMKTPTIARTSRTYSTASWRPAASGRVVHQPIARHTRTSGFNRVHRFEDSHALAASYGPTGGYQSIGARSRR